MAVEKIEYAKKLAFQTNDNVPIQNQCTSDDMNEIKETVNNNADELSTVQQNVENLQEGQGTSNSDISALKTKVSALENDNEQNKEDIQNKVDKIEGKGLSTEDFTAEEKQKLAGLNNYDDTEIIDLLPKVSNEGESIALENTARAKFTKFRIEGNSKQETREGYNLCNVTDQTKYGVTFKKMKNGILLNGKSTETFDVTVCEKTVAGGNYCIKGLGSTASNSTFQEVIYKNNKIDCYVATTSKIRAFADNDVLKSRFYIYKDVTFNNLLVPVQITKGDDKDYEPYGTMPSEEFPSEIKNVGNNINVFNKTAEDFKNGISYGWAKKLTLKLEPNTLYTCSSNDETPIGGNTNLLFGGNLTDSYFVNKDVSRTCLTNGDGDIDIYLRATTIDDFFEKYYIKVEKGTRATTSSEYGCGNLEVIISNENLGNNESHIVFPFVQGQKLMQGDYLADDGIHHTKTQIVLDGVTNGLKVANVTKHSNNIYYCVINLVKQSINNMNDINGMYCSHFMPHFEVRPGSCYIAGSGLYLVLVLTDQTITTVDAANTWLATQKEKGTPVVIEYELAEEEIETYTEVQKEAYEQIKNAISYKGQTNIFSTNEIKPIFEVEALADIGLLLNNMQAQILAGGK